jgi:hypothetical protein
MSEWKCVALGIAWVLAVIFILWRSGKNHAHYAAEDYMWCVVDAHVPVYGAIKLSATQTDVCHPIMAGDFAPMALAYAVQDCKKGERCLVKLLIDNP